MSRLFVVLGLVLTLGLSVAPTQALPASPVDNGIIFGGQWAPVNESTTSTVNLSELPAVVEVFTATWCENCVDVEHALDDVQAEGWLQQYHIHRAIGETQDPFGTVVLDQRWRDLYGMTSPPAVVFNGTMKKIGSVADDGDLKNEFTNLAKRDLGLGQGTSSFVWTPTSEQQGTLAWNLDIPAWVLENATLNVTAWLVEAAAEFEDGSNGLGTYPHIVHRLDVLGHTLNGTATVNIPTAFDGSDMEIHLLYNVIPDPVEEPLSSTEDENDEPNDTPSISIVMTGMVVAMAAAVFTRRVP